MIDSTYEVIAKHVTGQLVQVLNKNGDKTFKSRPEAEGAMRSATDNHKVAEVALIERHELFTLPGAGEKKD